MIFSISGQQVIRLPDGRLQLITIPQQKLQQQSQGNVVQAVAISTQAATPTRTIQVQGVSQTASIRPQTVVVNSAAGTVTPAVGGITPAKIVVASQASVPGVQGAILVSTPQASTQAAGTISIMTSSGPGIARIISPVKAATGTSQKAGSLMAVTQTPQGPRIIRQIAGTPQIVVQSQGQQAQQPVQQQQSIQLKQQQLQQHQQVLAQQQAQLKAVQQQHIKLPSGQIIQVAAGSGQQTITLTPQQLAAIQQSQLKQIKPTETPVVTVTSDQQSSAVTQTSESLQDQLVKQLKQTGANVPPGAATSSKAISDLTGQNKYAVTPQVVQEGK